MNRTVPLHLVGGVAAKLAGSDIGNAVDRIEVDPIVANRITPAPQIL